MTKSRRKRPDVIIIGGFLGAGKTTLVNRLLRSEQMANTALIVNELGDIAIDDDLIEHSGETMIELAGGCVCCAMVGTLAETLVSLADSGRPFDRVLIETTGLANVGPITNTVVADESLADRFAFDRVITVVDAVNGPVSMDRHPESVEQAAVADVIVVSKTDLVPDRSTVAGLEARLRRLNPLAPILGLDQQDDPTMALSAPVSLSRLDQAADGRPGDGRPGDGRPGDGSATDGQVGHHDAHITTVSIRRQQPLTESELASAWADIGEVAGPNLLRVKGLVAVEGRNGPAVVQGAQETMSAIDYRTAWPSEDRSTRLVFIGWDLDRDEIDGLFPGS